METGRDQRTTVRRLSQCQDSQAEFAKDLRRGMISTPKYFPLKYLYDSLGSNLFEKFATNPQYYVFSAEVEILSKHAADIMQSLAPDELVELGSGAPSAKTRQLMVAMLSTGCRRYVPLDISETILREAAETLAAEYEWLQVDAQVGDFESDLSKLTRNGRRLFVLLGNTVGNFAKREIFLKNLLASMLEGDAVLFGVDLVKDEEVMLSAYNDRDGLRKIISLNALAIMNRESGADFKEEHFVDHNIWNPKLSKIEFQIVAQQDTRAYIRDLQLEVTFSKHEAIQLGFSTKFTKERFVQELFDVGLSVIGWYTDNDERCAIVVAVPKLQMNS